MLSMHDRLQYLPRVILIRIYILSVAKLAIKGDDKRLYFKIYSL